MSYKTGMADVERLKNEKDCLDIRPDIARFAAEGFSTIKPDDIIRMRWYGFYQQKPNEGRFMWRIKLPGGRVTPQQLQEIGAITNEYGRGFSDITTRQDIQIHWLQVENFPDCLDRIYNKCGLYTEFSCGDTPRNICSCPLDGVIANQIVSLGDLVQKVSDMFKNGGKEFSNLPRKFKGSIAACPLHCHQPQINDFGFFGVIRTRNGVEERGLGLVVGGGLSSKPHHAQGLRIFIPESKIQQQVPAIAREIAHIFRDSDESRYKRTHARFKFVVAEKGWQWVRDQLEQRLGYQLEHDDSIVNPRGALHTDHMGSGLLSNGLYYVGAAVPRGRWSGDQMIAVGRLAERYAAPGQGQIRLSQKQNFLLVNIPQENVAPLSDELAKIGLPPHAPRWRESLVSCTGMQYCNLAVVETKDRAKEILEYLETEVKLDTPIMVSVTGCPNSCAQVHIADIGLSGTKATWNGEKMDAFDLMVGGCLGEDPRFAKTIIPKVPAPLVKKVIAQLTRTYLASRTSQPGGEVETFRQYAQRQTPQQLAAAAQIPDWTPPARREAAAPEA